MAGRGRAATKPAWLVEQEREQAAAASAGSFNSAPTGAVHSFNPNDYDSAPVEVPHNMANYNAFPSHVPSVSVPMPAHGGVSDDKEGKRDRDRDRDRDHRGRDRERDNSRDRGSKSGRIDGNGGGWRPDPNRVPKWDVKPQAPEYQSSGPIGMPGLNYTYNYGSSGVGGQGDPNAGGSYNPRLASMAAPNLSAYTSGAYNPSAPSGLLQMGGRANSKDRDPLTRIARQLYVGNLPSNVQAEDLSNFFNSLLPEVFQPRDLPADTSVDVNIFKEKAYAFVTFPSIGIAEALKGADGIQFPFNGGSHSLRLRRTAAFKPEMIPGDLVVPAINLGRQSVISTTVAEGPRKIFIGNIPPSWTDQEVITILNMFGRLKAFNLVKNTDSNLSKGFGFCEYEDQAQTDFAVMAINEIPGNGDKKLAAKISDNTSSGAKTQPVAMTGFQQAIPMLGFGAAPGYQMPTRILKLEKMITPEDVADDNEWRDIMEDTREEFSKYGMVNNVIIPRIKDGFRFEGMVYVEFASAQIASIAFHNLIGRKFDGRPVLSTYCDEDLYYSRSLF